MRDKKHWIKFKNFWYKKSSSSKSRRKQAIKKLSNKIVRRYNEDELGNDGHYKQAFDIPWTME